MIDNSNKLEEGWLTPESKISIVVPCYNEESQIGTVIESMPEFIDKIVVIDDS